ncbi:MAG: GNAT family N-acetyltransferase [Candidatus Magasanikbacteria bacterium]|nr:GNAT family N-acetyltransferase [Candidatus Magasanikbacteria bacterium]
MNLLETKIETERLLLIPVSLEYKEDMFREFTSEITQFMFPKPAQKVEDAEIFIDGALEKMIAGKDLVCMVLKKNDREYLGNAGLHHIDTTKPELGIWIKKSAHGNKYGREAMEALKKWADEHLDYEYISYPVDKKNIASRKIPESMGGVVGREYKLTGMGGQELDEVEYWIYKNSN